MAYPVDYFAATTYMKGRSQQQKKKDDINCNLNRMRAGPERDSSLIYSRCLDVRNVRYRSAHILYVCHVSLTKAALSAVGRRIRLADGAALAIGDRHLLAVGQLFAVDLIAEHLAVVAHANAARLRFPDVPVGVHLAVCRAAQVIACDTQREKGSS